MLNPKVFGYTLAVMAAGFWFVVMSFSLITGWGYLIVAGLGGFHPFFDYSWFGLIIMVIEHLVFGFAAGWIFGTLYNKFLEYK